MAVTLGSRRASRRNVKFIERPISAYRSRSLLHVAPDTTTEEAFRLLQERGLSSVAVMSGAALVGVCSATDLARAGKMVLRGFPRVEPSSSSPVQRVEDVMTRQVVALDERSPLWQAARAMVDARIHRVFVTKEGRPVGVLSTRDIMAAVRDERLDVRLRDVVTTDVETVSVDATISSAVKRLARSNVRGLVVVDEDWPVGAFTHLESIYAQALPEALRDQPVERIMSYETICFDQSTPLYRVAGHAVAMAARRILAVEQRRLAGIATGFDLARVVATLGEGGAL
jgi:CBS domain-containing protein